jgi:two-component system response regulator PilR (NtrC family)
VFISGASGVGKELVARTIHDQGSRRNAAFVPVNCGAIPSELMESEFFGHKKGSFTGALNDKEGLFQAAQGGTLFLDEIADLPLLMQVKLLRAIQEKAIRPVGSQKEISVDVRILSATHQNLRLLVQQNQFRQDLFYRINVIELPVPSLAARKEDIPELALHILSKLGGSNAPTLSKSALTALMNYDFPGNIRELENILERAYTLSESSTITPEFLQFQPAVIENTEGVRVDGTLPALLDDIERDRIEAVLVSVHWNKKSAATALGLSLRALRYRLKKLGIE